MSNRNKANTIKITCTNDFQSLPCRENERKKEVSQWIFPTLKKLHYHNVSCFPPKPIIFLRAKKKSCYETFDSFYIPRWFVANCSSILSSDSMNGVPNIPALFLKFQK